MSETENEETTTEETTQSTTGEVPDPDRHVSGDVASTVSGVHRPNDAGDPEPPDNAAGRPFTDPRDTDDVSGEQVRDEENEKSDIPEEEQPTDEEVERSAEEGA